MEPNRTVLQRYQRLWDNLRAMTSEDFRETQTRLKERYRSARDLALMRAKQKDQARI